jgi:BASS family bile acid:Na+ symporter
MLSPREVLLLVVVTLSAVAGLIWPGPSALLAPYLSLLMMGLLTLSFLKIRPADVGRAIRLNPGLLAVLASVKLFVWPALVYPLARWLVPDFALALLLLAGVSTGVTAPFMAGLIGASVALTLVVAAVTSLLLPLSLPLMVRLLAGQEFHSDLVSLALLLAAIIFIPLLLAWSGQRLTPRLVTRLERVSFPLSLIFLALVNLGAFGRYGGYLKAHLDHLLWATLLTVALAVVQGLMGRLVLFRAGPAERAAAMGCLVWINNVLIVVLGLEMDDAPTAVAGVMYLLPFFASVGPLAWLRRRAG